MQVFELEKNEIPFCKLNGIYVYQSWNSKIMDEMNVNYLFIVIDLNEQIHSILSQVSNTSLSFPKQKFTLAAHSQINTYEYQTNFRSWRVRDVCMHYAMYIQYFDNLKMPWLSEPPFEYSLSIYLYGKIPWSKARKSTSMQINQPYWWKRLHDFFIFFCNYFDAHNTIKTMNKFKSSIETICSMESL